MYLVKVTFYDKISKCEKQYVINEYDTAKAIKKLDKEIKKNYDCDKYQIDMMEHLFDTELI
jgi:sulfur relay (sulfurtransferase) DsrC/TusE family protein